MCVAVAWVLADAVARLARIRFMNRGAESFDAPGILGASIFSGGVVNIANVGWAVPTINSHNALGLHIASQSSQKKPDDIGNHTKEAKRTVIIRYGLSAKNEPSVFMVGTAHPTVSIGLVRSDLAFKAISTTLPEKVDALELVSVRDCDCF